MSERFGKIFTLDKKLWCKDSPVLIEKEALLKDFYVNQYLVQLKFINLSSKTITGLTIKILYCDKINNKSGEAEFTYTDLNALKGEYFGDRKPLYIPDENARDFEFTITKVVFDDNSQWNNENKFMEIATNKAYAERNIIEQLKRDLNTYEYISMPEFSGDHWYCVCGQFNINSEDECCKCKRNSEELRKVSDINILTDNLKNYEQRQADKQKKIAEQKKKGLRALKIFCLVVVVAVIGVSVGRVIKKNIDLKREYELEKEIAELKNEIAELKNEMTGEWVNDTDKVIVISKFTDDNIKISFSGNVNCNKVISLDEISLNEEKVSFDTGENLNITIFLDDVFNKKLTVELNYKKTWDKSAYTETYTYIKN